MAIIQDDNFWRRFSVAVHQSEENTAGDSLVSNSSSIPCRSLKHSDSWLESQQRKQKRNTIICWSFWLCLGGLITAIVLVLLWLKSKGYLKK